MASLASLALLTAGGNKTILLHVLLLQLMEAEPQSASLLSLFSRTTPFGWVILSLLLVFSLLSWTIIVRKWLTFKSIERQNGMFISFFRKTPRLSEVSAGCEHYRNSPLSGLFSAAYQELSAQLQTNPGETMANPKQPQLGERQVRGIQRALQRGAAAELTVLETAMSWLATTASVTPFIGLLGTVVGIISAFQGMSMEGTTSIQAVAPGIAEALAATAAGLFAAIPAVIAYNQFIRRIKIIGAEMDDFAAEFLNLVERSFS